MAYARLLGNGTRHFYHSGTEKRDCIWGDARARNVNWIDAAMLQDAPAAFELQLPTTQRTTIERRETFYSENGIRPMWGVGSIEKQLEKTAFKEIYMRYDGQIFE